MHMVGGLALRVYPAGRMPAQLHRRRQLASGVNRQDCEAATRIFEYRIVGNEQVTPISGKAGMGGFIAQALHLVDQGQLMVLRVNAVAADAADRVSRDRKSTR